MTEHDSAGNVVPLGTDFNDLVNKYGEEAARRALENAEAPPPWEAVKLPPDWRVSRRGVRRVDDEDNEDWVALAPVWVDALTRHPSAGGWGAVVRWLDRDGQEQERAIPFSRFHEQGNGLAQELADDGLAVIPGKERKLAAYLGSCSPEARVQSLDRLGWLEDKARLAFVQPHHVIAQGGEERAVYQPEAHSPTAQTMHASGTLAEWKSHVAEPCRGNPALIFSLCTALAAPLLRAGEIESGGFHVYGTTTAGKTTWLQVAASAFGNGADPSLSPDTAFIRRWNATSNAIEGLAAAHNDLPLCLDEIGTCSARDQGVVVYNIAGGQGRSALNRDRSLRGPRTWRTLLLSTGEKSVQEAIAEAGQTIKGGQLVRVADLPLTPIQDPHGQAVEDFADQLKRACARYYGTAGPAFVERLITESEDVYDLRSTVADLLDGAAQAITPERAAKEQRRVIKRFALATVAGWLASRFDLLPYSAEEITEASRDAANRWLADTTNLSEGERGVEQLRSFILRFGGSRFESKDNSGEVRDRAGYFDPANDLYLFTEDGFREACGGHNPQTTAKELSRRGLLYKNDSARLRSRHSIRGRRITLYAVKADVIGDE